MNIKQYYNLLVKIGLNENLIRDMVMIQYKRNKRRQRWKKYIKFIYENPDNDFSKEELYYYEPGYDFHNVDQYIIQEIVIPMTEEEAQKLFKTYVRIWLGLY